jgi:transcriptional regulator with XRE-family HTH domain
MQSLRWIRANPPSPEVSDIRPACSIWRLSDEDFDATVEHKPQTVFRPPTKAKIRRTGAAVAIGYPLESRTTAESYVEDEAAQPMTVSEKIAARRKQLGLSKLETAGLCQLSINEYDDIESHPDAVLEAALLRQMKDVCRMLRLELGELFAWPCAFCNEGKPFADEYRLARNELVRLRRTAMGLTVKDLGSRVGFHESEIDRLEGDPARIESWVIDDILRLAIELDIPLQVLLAAPCGKCGH